MILRVQNLREVRVLARDYLMAPWKNALIVKVLGITVGYSSPSAMEEDKRRFGYIFFTREDFFLINFDNYEDRS
jgi:hypothetical protein